MFFLLNPGIDNWFVKLQIFKNHFLPYKPIHTDIILLSRYSFYEIN